MQKLADEVFEAARGWMAKSVDHLKGMISTLDGRLKALEDREPAKDGAPGEPGAAGEKGAPGERGEPGPAGERGEKGEPGPAGKDGAPGDRGEKGEPGGMGPQGERGEKGMDGRDGMEGPAGRDAAQLEILSGIDPERKYQRNVYASHKGGLWRSYRPTDLLGDDAMKAGWECIVNGLDAVDVDLQDDLRTLSITIRHSNGHTVAHRKSMPVVIDRGIWTEGKQYAQGDSVTWNGSVWIAEKESPDGRPGDGVSKDWRLSAKRGDKGESNYRIAVRNGFKGSESEWLETLKAKPAGPVKLEA
jgi:hypothetical protein